jgi:hypothetical protein
VALQGNAAQQRPPADLGDLRVNPELPDDFNQFACEAKAESMVWIHLRSKSS